jgi:hypothetical protein
VFGFDIEFGNRGGQNNNEKLTLEKFYALVLEADSKVAARATTPKSDQPHVYACLGGLLSNSTSPEVKETDPWNVRGGPLKYAINSHFAVGKASVNEVIVPEPEDLRKDAIYAKPMHLVNQMNRNDLIVTVKDQDGNVVNGWRTEPIMKSVPSGLWGQCTYSSITFVTLQADMPSR